MTQDNENKLDAIYKQLMAIYTEDDTAFGIELLFNVALALKTSNPDKYSDRLNILES